MDHLRSPVRPAATPDSLGVALNEIDVAIELVRRGSARRVRLYGLSAGEQAAGAGLARAQEAGLHFAVERGAARGLISLIIGPAIDD